MTIATSGERSAARRVVTHVEGTTSISLVLRLIVGKDSGGTRGDQTSVVETGVISIRRETVTPIVVACTTGSGKGTGRVQPDKTVGVGNPVGDRNSDSHRAERLANGSIALDSLSTKRMTSNDDLVDIREDRLVGIILDQLIKDIIRRDISVLDGVLVGTTASPL